MSFHLSPPYLWETDTHSDSETEGEEKVSGKERRTCVVEQLRSGRSPMEILEGMSIWRPPEFWAVVDFLSAHGQMAKALEVSLNTYSIYFSRRFIGGYEFISFILLPKHSMSLSINIVSLQLHESQSHVQKMGIPHCS